MEKTIGILGGMGPLATADLFRKITLLTDAARDNDHIRVYIDSNARIPDRTAAILSGGKDPVPEMASALRSLEACGASCVIMPCNTAHYFLPRLQAMTKLPFISMLEAQQRPARRSTPAGPPPSSRRRARSPPGSMNRRSRRRMSAASSRTRGSRTCSCT